MDGGKYHKNKEDYERLAKEMYATFQPVTLSPEYSQFVQEDLLRFLIRLSRYKFVARLLSKTDNVLEIGSGSGLGSIFLGQHCQSVFGLDVKEADIEEAICLNKRKNVTFSMGDFFDLDGLEKYDVIVSLDVIEHLAEDEGEKMIAKTKLHLKEGGMVIVGSPSHYSYPYQSEISQASHIKCYKQDELRSVIGRHFARVLPFSMNDEVVHTGHPKMAWYYFMVATCPRESIS